MTVSIDLSTTRLAQVRHELGRVIVGQDRVVDRLLVAVLAEGHVLLEGAPGLGKTLLLATLARILGGSFNRIQFTPDLIPSDIVGTRIFRPSSEVFDVEPGPIIANVVLVDEINRAPARVQSALLEAMAERQVTVGGRTFALPKPFLVVATQNPVESEGVYPLAEAQRDRFLMRIPVDYPTPSEEWAIVARTIHPRLRVCSIPRMLSNFSTRPGESRSTMQHPTTRSASCSRPATPRRTGCRSWSGYSSMARAREHRSGSSEAPGPWRSCGDACVRYRRTSTTSRTTS
jgi:MoxR-like ATPase